MLLNCVHIVADYLVEDDIANDFFLILHCLQPIYSIFRLNEFGLSCCLQHWTLSGQFSLPISSILPCHSSQIKQTTTDHTEYFYVYYKMSPMALAVANVNNNHNKITTAAAATLNYAVWVCAWFLLHWFVILVKFSLDWLAHGRM